MSDKSTQSRQRNTPRFDIPESGDLYDATNKFSLIGGIHWSYFIVVLAIVFVAGWAGIYPDNMIGGFVGAIALGALLTWVGSAIPYFRDYGGPVLLCLLVPILAFEAGLIPETVGTAIENWTSGYEFIDFYIAALIAGSILGMPRRMLISVGIRYGIPLVGTVLLVFAVIGTIGAALGFGFTSAIFLVAAPVVGGGVGAGAIPMSEMYAENLGGSSDDYLSLLIPAVLLANIVTIVLAGVLNGINQRGEPFKGFNGNGNLLKARNSSENLTIPKRPLRDHFNALAVGVLLSGALFIAGSLMNAVVPPIHGYAWTILFAAFIKIFGLLPKNYEAAASSWFGFVAGAWTPALLVGVSFAYIDVSSMLEILTNPLYLFLVVLTPIISAVIAGLLGLLVRFYAMESVVCIGLGMTDSGGTGDVAVVTAAKRLQLMPFMQISSRLGGAFVLVVVSILLGPLGLTI
ncbi:2-hydroxycarboxylate transporter family protein [Auritidibacter ignavus]|uniref:2-hydroxycarboxylate transporter family protein n=1 Tax=Auritidibacter ignavus TaxID=678932 RepID=UPI00109C986B|nr:2-hydroxycarboxylate transporter family protein [Auritidibacter ignavus]